FFPNLTCLGDILEAEGYVRDMSFGSDATFGGRRLCFTQHGNYDFHDWKYYTTNGELPPDYKVWWGFEDEKLFAFAKDRLGELSSQDAPFAFTMLTVDTHYPEGYVCELCGDEFPEQYANVIRCSDNQVSEFIEWCQQQPWYENTTIILSGDHPTMNKEFCSSASFDYRRKCYTAYINAAVEPERDDYREFATVDNFPTTLAALGVEIEGNRLGLGTNLFSSEDTLIERDGLDYVNTELQKSSDWMDEQSNLKEVTADIEYRDYDPETHTITMVLSNVTSEQVDSFHVSMHMYGYLVNGKDYVSWSDSVEEEEGVHVVTINIPVDQAFSGRIKIQPHCMIDGVRGIHLDTHYYYLSYDEGGANADAYQCNRYGEELKDPTFWDKAKDWWDGVWPF
ncbi:MAG: sulfatase-like hydrolase/transferase, partial [Lachnospiraceae bacterium]|nr:sulfatase-like hydrolase/transferase [Lachnospiraceae bacterium]